MGSHEPKTGIARSTDEPDVRALYRELLECWNRRDAHAMASLCIDDGSMIGFDGSLHDGRAEIESDIGRIFADHPTGAYVGKVKSIRFPAADVAIVGAVAGILPSGGSDLNPAANSVQTLVVVKRDGAWRIALFQNTPAAYHGRPELSEQLTEELRQVLRNSRLDTMAEDARR
jgi:uncharacterized protein (TIGR02246 family)